MCCMMTFNIPLSATCVVVHTQHKQMEPVSHCALLGIDRTVSPSALYHHRNCCIDKKNASIQI